MAKRYAPNGRDMLLTERGLKHLIRATCVAHLSFSGDANPFVLTDISPSRGIASWGRQECGAITEGGETPPLRMVAVFTRTTNVVYAPVLSF